MPGSRKGVRGRLQDAALRLYTERGFERTTAADIAELAGVTERTYFRHFPDKREVLFDGQAGLEAALANAVLHAPALDLAELLRHAFLSLAPLFESDRALQQQRHRVISRTPELQERSATKLSQLSAIVANGLERRGIPPPLAFLAASCGIAVLTRVRREWLAGSSQPYSVLLADAFDDLGSLLHAQALAEVPSTSPPPGPANTIAT